MSKQDGEVKNIEIHKDISASMDKPSGPEIVEWIGSSGLKDRLRSRSNSQTSQNSDGKATEASIQAQTTVGSAAMSLMERAANMLKTTVASATSLLPTAATTTQVEPSPQVTSATKSEPPVKAEPAAKVDSAAKVEPTPEIESQSKP